MDKTKKRLIILFSILGVIVLLVVLSSFAFTLQQADVRFYAEDGSPAVFANGPTSDLVLGTFKGKSIFTLDENKLGDSINERFSDYYCIEIERVFPNKVIVHMAQRKEAFYLEKDNVKYAVDVQGWVISQVEGNNGLVNISNFATLIDTVEEGKPIVWATPDAQSNFEYLQRAVKTIWRFKYNYNELSRIVSKFTFDGNTMTITTVTQSRIVIKGIQNDLENKVQKSIGVYYSRLIDTTIPDITIEVDDKGNVTTTNN